MIRKGIVFLSAMLLVLSLAAIAAIARDAAPANGVSAISAQAAGAKNEMSAAELKKRMAKGGVVVLDVRGDVGGEMIKGAQHVPLAKLDDWAKNQRKGTMVVSYCTCPHDEAAESATEKLRGMGFPRAFSLKGGLQAAKTAGIPVGAP